MMRKVGGLVIVEKKHNYHPKVWTIILLITGLVTSCQCKLPAMAAENRYPADRLQSTGRMEYGEVVLDAADLESIRDYITEKQSEVADILLQLGTKLRQEEGKISIDRNPDHTQEVVDRAKLDWQILIQAVSESQTIPAGLPVLHQEYAMGIEGVEERTDCYETAIADNISKGKAAWADGILLLGNGVDNDKAYEQGVEDGTQNIVPENLYPIYEVKDVTLEISHVHIGQKEDKEGTSGCYHNYSEVKVEEKRCGRTLYKTAVTWYPDEDHPDGGTWHGGYYTCGNHGGIYDSPGICTYKTTEKTTVWHHDVVCGLTDAVYAVLHIRGTDTDYYDREILLEAELEPKEGYEQLIWQEGDELLWTDAEDNLLGIGPKLSVHSPGIYKCCINAANADIDIRTGSAEVNVAGLVLPK